MNTDCQICVAPLNKVNYEITCLYCEFTACKSCQERYILDNIQTKCMSCSVVWNNEFIKSKFTKTFYEKYLKHKTKIQITNEKNELGQYMETAKKCKEYEKRIKEYKSELKRLDELEIVMEYDDDLLTNYENTIKNRVARAVKNETYNGYVDLINVAKDYIARFINEGRCSKKIQRERKKFVRKCPLNECRGFLSTQWKCQLCEKYTCKECGEENADEHKCNPDNVESMKNIDSTTTPCPKCGIFVFKIDGCPQIFCTSCHTAFNFKTGQIDTSPIHNPHYFDWMRSNNKEIPRFDDPGIGACNQLHIQDDDADDELFEFANMVRRIDNDIIPRFTTTIEVIDLRMKYLLNMIDEEKWIRLLKTRTKKANKTQKVFQIYEMFKVASSDIISRINGQNLSYSDVKHEIKSLIDYTNKQLILSNTNNCYFIKDFTLTQKQSELVIQKNIPKKLSQADEYTDWTLLSKHLYLTRKLADIKKYAKQIDWNVISRLVIAKQDVEFIRQFRTKFTIKQMSEIIEKVPLEWDILQKYIKRVPKFSLCCNPGTPMSFFESVNVLSWSYVERGNYNIDGKKLIENPLTNEEIIKINKLKHLKNRSILCNELFDVTKEYMIKNFKSNPNIVLLCDKVDYKYLLQNGVDYWDGLTRIN